MPTRSTSRLVVLVALAGCGAKVPSSITSPTLGGDPPPAPDRTIGDVAGSMFAGDGPAGEQAPAFQQGLDADVARARVDPDRGNCTAENLVIARQQGLTGLCWDPPGATEFSTPVHVEPGMRKMTDEVYWFDMPREAELEPNHNGAVLPSVGGHTFAYEPYSADGGRAAPAIPRLVGLTVDEALAAIDRLDAPLSVELITWTSSCPQPAGHVCDQNFQRDDAKLNVIIRGAE